MAKRVESASSINTFKQCKRKYYYQYVVKLPTASNIHQLRGNIAHSTLESFYDINVQEFTEENYVLKYQEAIQRLFLYHWNLVQPELKKLNLNMDQEMFYFEETMLMLMNWCNQFLEKMGTVMKAKQLNVGDAFNYLTPVREQEYTSEKLFVHGFIDAIHHYDDEVHIIDYKTNNDFEIKDSIKLQLSLYSLMYHEKHGKLPDKLGVFFLRHKLKLMNVDPDMLDSALRDISMIHAHTTKTEQVEDYPQTQGKLCKWGSGQCDFFDECKPFAKPKEEIK
ncbi:MAG: PD-(D/E)XK nuclease family protein [Candidatus Woesearchaeota archaeon]